MNSGPPGRLTGFPSRASVRGNEILPEDPRRLGFLAAARARGVEQVIGNAEALVIALGEMHADPSPAREALDAARALCLAREYSEAAVQAKRATALATRLNERFTAYVAAWKVLHECWEDLERFGFPTDVLDAELGAADRETVRQVEEAGTLVPNYHGATAILERAAENARALVAAAAGASQEIFLATLAASALAENLSTQAPSWMVVRLEELIEQATRELALGHADAARKVAAQVRREADDALAGASRVTELLEMTAAILDGLEAEGPLADGLVERTAAARAAFEGGFLDWTTASVVARQLSDDVAAFAKHYPRSRRAVERAVRAYALLQKEGFSSYEAEGALSDAQSALAAGDWSTVRERVLLASRTLIRLRGDQEVLRRSIAELDERAALLKGFRLPLLADVEDILGRAKEEVRCGRLSGAGEDLLLAKTLMLEATRSGS